MQGTFLRKYGVQTTVDFHLFEVDGVDFRVDAAHASGDTTIMKDEGAEANTSNGFTDEGKAYSIVITATEMEAARIMVDVVDQGTKAWLDTGIVIETYGNASAMHAFDLDTATQDVNAVQISGDSTAADNLELDYDGTGYVKVNSTIGTCTTNTDVRGTDSAALASVCTEGRLAELDAANLPTDISNLNDFDPAVDVVANVTLVDTTTTNTDMRGTDSAGLATELAKVPKSDGSETFNSTALASINAEVDTALNTAIPGSPTADSINEYVRNTKFAIINKIEITEANGNATIYADDDTTPYATVAAAYTTDATTTTRKRLE